MLNRAIYRVTLLTIFIIGTASAQYYNNTQHLIGERAAGMGGAVTAVTDNSTSLWYNPAGLSGIQSASLNISANSYSYLTSKVDGQLSFADINGKVKPIDLEESEFSIVGTSMVFGKKLKDGVGLGFGLFAPIQEDLRSVVSGAVPGQNMDIMVNETSSKSSKHYIGMAGMGYSLGDLNIGLALAAGQYSKTLITNVFTHLNYGSDAHTTITYQGKTDISMFTSFMAIGGQFKFNNHHHLGLTAKSPTFVLSGTEITDELTWDISFVPRIFTLDSAEERTFWPNVTDPKKDTVEYSFLSEFSAMNITVGYGYILPETFGLTLELAYHLDEAKKPNPTIDFKFGSEVHFSKYILRIGGFTDFSQKDYNKFDYYGGTVGFSIPKEFTIIENDIKTTKRLWSTFGVVYRYGAGNVTTTQYSYDFENNPRVQRDQTIHNISAFIAESISF